jgi:hypothetical protein
MAMADDDDGQVRHLSHVGSLAAQCALPTSLLACA